MNNSIPPHMNYPATPPKGVQRTNKRAVYKKKTSPIIILIELILAIISVTVAVMLVSRIPCDITVEYTHTVLPTTMSAQNTLLAENIVDEADVPITAELPEYIFSEVVPESEAVDFSYFDDTVFIGDSRTQGLLLYTKITPYNFSAQGLNVTSLQKKAFIRLPDENGELQSYTLIEALTRESGNYKSIYIATGLNELGWQLPGFINAFSSFIDALREVTDVPIYVQLIIPVTAESSENSEFGITNEKCHEFNAALRELVAERELFLLDPISLFTLEDGTLDPAHSFDGIHLNVKSCSILADYYRTHTVNTYYYSNTTPAQPEEEAEYIPESTEE